ncbi:cardiolipin synthase [Psychromonas ossibalaenae]|uniref:cardiolipin synthase n=1 Tax=Psychromonas ossibalaenae TaxID=444922 RepID=UPI00038279FC|nr:cardiolipin synthase [Psychromonas ossibalaenae]
MDFFSLEMPWQDSTLYVALSALLYFSLLLLTSLRVVIKRKPIGISLAWLFLIYALPLFGMISYFIFGELHLGRKRQRRREEMSGLFQSWLHNEVTENRIGEQLTSPSVMSMRRFVESYTSMPMMQGNKLTLLSSTEAILTELQECIDQAQHSCYLMFYICYEGGLADNVIEALIRASQRGVSCKVLLDSVGSHDFFKSVQPQRMRDSGVEVVEALPVGALRLLFQRQDLRLHRKLICIDEKVAYTGSMNLVDPAYFKKGQGFGQWVDMMVRCEGPIVQLMQGLFIWDWYLETNVKLSFDKLSEKSFAVKGEQNVQLIPSGPEFGKASIHQVLLTAIYEAKDSLVLTTPYFVPDDSLQEALTVAALRGVDVKIILPAKNNSFMVKYASRAFFDELLCAGVKIYKFHGGLLHSKSIVVDEKIALLGTVNLDRRSFWLNFEMTMLVDNRYFTSELLNLQMNYLADSQRLQLEEWQSRSYGKKLLESCVYLFSPLL